MTPSPRPSFLVAATLAAVFELCTGCTSATTYTVQVDAISQPATGGTTAQAAPASASQSYYIHSKNPRLDESSLRYKEVSDYVKTALSAKGMYEAPKPEAADVVIDIDYGMDAPRVKFQTLSTPVVVEEMSRVERVQELVPVLIPGTTNYTVVPMWRDHVVPGRTDVIGMREEVTPMVVYEKYLKVSARENKESSEGKAPAEVWSVNVSAEDNSQELRKYIPILASATADYIGANTKEEKEVKIDEKDDAVKFIKKGM
jgi:hypothetical protein